ncbi:hypothetical protein ACSVHK_05185 [Acinetobacter nosocomialis]|uniref:hypothetical protein n=1 Tax=Acinetobacter nosocomialis TaxID=106654 RepID=UPI00054BAD41|nr:hypothetical protein [Acinetobacter nosocomialis]SSQ36073.1 Uncharacterised protein [Acinetobacter baumannii]MBD8350664.1 hypothetical protein [Acinetobacter nosocomialis]MBJ8493448.1 hypothetical protein [Acinetobacter nosocomialis]MBZ6531167.1 hypothetical protein [Acinetobacter nosocomialis]MDI9745021.1 hypothetical protein [Acinetobacter nosocomialis]
MATAIENRARQLKNAKRGGYAPTIAKDVNKHKVQKLRRALDEARRYVSELNDETIIFDDQDARQKAEGAKAIIEMFETALSGA